VVVDSLVSADHADAGADVDVDARREYVECRSLSTEAEAMLRPLMQRVDALPGQ
jgi:hypothetical protein